VSRESSSYKRTSYRICDEWPIVGEPPATVNAAP